MEMNTQPSNSTEEKQDGLEVSPPSATPDLPPLVQLSGSFLLATSLFGVAAIVAFGSLGKNTPWGWGFAALAVVSGIAWLLGTTQKEKVARDAGGKQRALLGVNALTSTVLVLVLLVGINYIAARRQKTFDLTRNGVNSLAPQTVEVLNKLTDKAKLTYVYASGPMGGREPNPKNQALLSTYQNASDKIAVRYVDALADPAAFRGLGLPSFSGQPVLLAELPKKPAPGATVDPLSPEASSRQEVSVIDEQNLTSALMKLVDPKPSTVYFVTGHGELEPARPEMAAGKTALEGQNFVLNKVSLLKAGASVPADASALFIMAPKVDFTAQEITVLNNYIGGKGRVAVFLSPAAQPLPKLEAWIKTLGLTVGKGAVVDSQSYGAPTNIQADLGDSSRHPLLRGVSADLVLPDSVPLTAVTPAPTGLTVNTVFESSADAGTVVNQQLQRGGPYILVAAVEKGESRVLISANANFAVQGALEVLGNKSFLLAAANWTVGNDSLVSIPAKAESTSTITMDAATQRFAALYSLLVVPFVVLLVGTIMWWKRR